MIDYFGTTTSTILLVILSLVYYVYYRKFRYFIFDQSDKVTKGKISRGKCPPFFPNGWYWIINSRDLAPGDVKAISYCGRDVVLFRGQNGKPYILEAYCAHMGAHLGEGGTVRHDTCIECPFHGWAFDGETGKCVLSGGENKIQRIADKYEYFDIERCSTGPSPVGDGSVVYLQKVAEAEEIKLKRYVCREMNGSILVWYHSDENLREKPLFEPFDVDDELILNKMEARGDSINYVNCHVQEIPENGADVRHFDFLHTSILDHVPFVKFSWTMKSERATNPRLNEIMTHPHPEVNVYKMRILNKFLNDANRPYTNVISLNCYFRFFGKHELFVFNATGFQLGPGLVYLFLWSPYFQATFFQTVTPLEKFHQRVMHRIFSTKTIPYFLSAIMLMGEVKQLFSDMNIWNNKVFGSKLHYNMKNDADKGLHSWRNWFAQFYDGCYDYERKSLSW